VIANRRAGDHARPVMPDEANDAVTRAREPQLDPRIENLVRRRIPPKWEYQLSRALVSVVGSWQV
jgi:hypothetical protein